MERAREKVMERVREGTCSNTSEFARFSYTKLRPLAKSGCNNWLHCFLQPLFQCTSTT
jgi:hypothetical protein